MPLVLDSIQISDLELKIFDTLKAVLQRFHLHTQLRVAGGWVRDKLLGKECYDIDIALDDMLGRVFCDKVNEYLKSIGEDTHGMGVIQSNPDQSKHLETARMRMFGVWIDFVNLRAETYADNSRIPTMEFGTAEEDAYRRDLTINSLFYNINTGAVEDFTGKGISHLKDGIIATPLPAKTTFLDDPLRVLRAIRFAARFDYKLEEDLKKAAADKDVKDALASKVSRERVGHEIDLMLVGDHPVRAMQNLVNMGIFWIVFSLPKEVEANIPNDTGRLCVSILEAVCEILDMFGPSKLTSQQRRICHFAALLLPLQKFTYQDRKKREIPVSNTIIRDSLKLKADDADKVVALHRAAEQFWDITECLLNEENCNQRDVDGHGEGDFSSPFKQAVSAGMVMMEIKEHWRVSLLLSSVIEAPDLTVKSRESQLKERTKQCLAVESAILQLGLENVWERKPLLDGNTIISELGLKHGGPEVKEWQDRLRKWQLGHLTGSADECLEWFRKERAKRQKCA